ncbi:hypothetical protein GWK26_11910 [haloarchaeon 3A1-DGR]|nr:hypothetical protein GWK26_11910 [haloarchaeon 3A1-DGR]
MDRRTFLASTSIGATAFAGCTTAQEIVRTGPPNFGKVTIDGPDEVPVGEEFVLTVNATNTGGETGDFTGELNIGQGILQSTSSVTIEEVPVTQTKETTIGPYRLDTAREIQFQLPEHAATHTVQVVTRDLDFGETFEYDSYTLSLDLVGIEHYLTTGEAASLPIITPEDADAFAIVNLEIEKADETAFYARSIGTSDGGSVQFDTSEAEPEHIEQFSDPFSVETFNEEGSESGQVLLPITIQEGTPGVDIVKNEVDDSPPDLRWSLQDQSLPSFDVTVNEPESSTIGESVEIELVVENTGSEPGTYRSQMLKDPQGYSTNDEYERNDIDLAPGESRTITYEVTPDGLSPPRYEFLSAGRTVTLDPSPRQLDFGESVKTDEGTSYSVDSVPNQPMYVDELTYESALSDETIESGSGTVFAVVEVEIESPGDGVLSHRNYRLQFRDMEYEPTRPQFGAADYTSPIDGSGYSSYTDSPGGLLIFEVPEASQSNDIMIRATFSGEHGDYPIEWTE